MSIAELARVWLGATLRQSLTTSATSTTGKTKPAAAYCPLRIVAKTETAPEYWVLPPCAEDGEVFTPTALHSRAQGRDAALAAQRTLGNRSTIDVP